MKVKKLIEVLSELDPETIVVLSRDSEGNGFSPLSSFAYNVFYIPENTWSGEVYDREEWDEWSDGESVPSEAESALVLWPVN
jgi:hypothetical protein